MDHEDPELNAVLDLIAAHFAYRRDALVAIAPLADRFEQWMKWEIVVALHHALLLEPRPWFTAVGVEPSAAGGLLYVGVKPVTFDPRSEDDEWVERDERDVLIDVSGRIARDRAARETSAVISLDRTQLRARVDKARGLAVTMVLRHPAFRTTPARVTESLERRLGPPSYRRAIVDGGEAREPLAVLVAWDAAPGA